MPLRALLPILTYPDPTPVAALTRAASLAVALRAQLTAIVHEVDIPPITNPVAGVLVDVKAEAAAAERLSRQRGQEIGQRLDQLCRRLGLPLATETLRVERPCGEAVAAAARTFDLTLLVCRPDSTDHALLEQDVLFGSGGPVVIFPADDAPSHIGVVAVAWDGSRAAARAIRDAVPLLRQAGGVRLLTCSEDKPISARAIDGMMTFLAAHEIEARHMSIGLAGQAVGMALQHAALAQDAGLLVMGAYGHSRLREFILGGATTSVLNAPVLPLFMSH